MIMQSLITLLSPFKWNFVTITYLTSEMEEYLENPCPYLVGMSSTTWEKIRGIKDYSEVIFFNLETQDFLIERGETRLDLPDLPKEAGGVLLESFKRIIYRKDKMIK